MFLQTSECRTERIDRKTHGGPPHLQFRVVTRKPIDLGTVFNDPNVLHLAPAHCQSHVVSDVDNERVGVFTQDHRTHIALSARVPIGFSFHVHGE